VHGLYDFFMNAPALRADAAYPDAACDVPLLLAPVPFEGAAVSRLHIRLTSSAVAPAAADGGTAHKLELRGRIPPWTLHRVARLVRRTQDGDLAAVLESEPGSGALNLDAGALACGGGADADAALAHAACAAAAHGGAESGEEEALWQAAPGALAGRCIRAFTWGGGGVVAKLGI